MIPKRRKRPKMGLREEARIRCLGHLKWLRGFVCAIGPVHCVVPRRLEKPWLECGGKVQAAHVRTGTDGAMGEKPSDCWAIPLCAVHHREQHDIGEPAFEKRYGFDMKAVARELWKVSPHRFKCERKARATGG